MKLIPMYVGKVTRKEQKFTKGGTELCILTIPFEGSKKDDSGKPITLWVDCTFFSDRDTGSLPKVLNYVNKGSVIGIEGQIDLEKWDGGAKIVLSYPRIHLLPRPTEEVSEDGPDNFADDPSYDPTTPAAPVEAGYDPATDPFAQE